MDLILRPTFRSTLHQISFRVIISTFIVCLLLSVASLLILKQYVQENLKLNLATVSYGLDTTVFRNGPTGRTLSAFGTREQFNAARVMDINGKEPVTHGLYKGAEHETVSGLLSRSFYPNPVKQYIWHNGKIIGEVQLISMDTVIELFFWLFLSVVTSCILLASLSALTISRLLHRDIESTLQKINDLVHNVRSNRNFYHRVSLETNNEFRIFAQEFNSLLNEIAKSQRELQCKIASLQKAVLHDDLTGLANRAAFRTVLDKLAADADTLNNSALLFMDGDNFKCINDTWGHVAGDAVLVEVGKRLLKFSGARHLGFRLGGDEFAMLLSAVDNDAQAHNLLMQLKGQLEQPIQLPNKDWVKMILSTGVALAKDTSLDRLIETADRNMYMVKHKRRELLGKQPHN